MRIEFVQHRKANSETLFNTSVYGACKYLLAQLLLVTRLVFQLILFLVENRCLHVYFLHLNSLGQISTHV